MYLSLVLGALICAGINRMSIPGMMVQVCYSLILGVVFMTLLHAGQDMKNRIPRKHKRPHQKLARAIPLRSQK